MTVLRIGAWVIVGLAILAVIMLALAWTPDRSVESLKPRWAKAPSEFIALDGMQVHVRDEGIKNDPVPIILLHGTGASLYSWQGWTDDLKATRRVVRFDRPGFGLTGPNPSGDYTMAYYTRFLRAFMDKLGIEKAVIAGNSSGGQMAWEFAAAHPDRVAGLILAAPGGYPRSTPLPAGLRIAMSPWASPLLEHILPKSQVGKGLEGMFGDPSKVTPDMVDRNYELTLRAGNRKALGATLRQNLDKNSAPLIAGIKTPTLILWGGKDSVIPVKPDAERFHREIAGSKLVAFPGLGHMVQEEDPAASLVPVKAFLSTLD